MGFDKQKYNDAYNKAKYINISFRISRDKDKHIMEMLSRQENVKAYICDLITKDIKRFERRTGFVRNRGDRSVHLNYSKYPYEVIEWINDIDRYTVGFAENMDAAVTMAVGYSSARDRAHGPLRIYERDYDDYIKAYTCCEVHTQLDDMIEVDHRAGVSTDGDKTE